MFHCNCWKNSNKGSRSGKAPEPAGAWPIIGHLHLLGGKDQLLYRTLGALADKYGPAFSIRLGGRRAFVVSSWEMAKDCFTVNDKALASRPMQRLEMLKHVRISEVDLAIKELYKLWANDPSAPVLVELNR
ncbi:hypothetical protein Tsubulata_009283 [Turnera subulata]|uniref:Cytochrome P450 n=1 Tax=Turnera subulata TaxID=218843 RepID=A0A9Q0FG36_9ROSI|nr:hypothetical protein Tsubulata_009283 [Turnera subulata]